MRTDRILDWDVTDLVRSWLMISSALCTCTTCPATPSSIMPVSKSSLAFFTALFAAGSMLKSMPLGKSHTHISHADMRREGTVSVNQPSASQPSGPATTLT